MRIQRSLTPAIAAPIVLGVLAVGPVGANGSRAKSAGGQLAVPPDSFRLRGRWQTMASEAALRPCFQTRCRSRTNGPPGAQSACA